MKLVPNGQKILEMAGVPNGHQLSLRARVSYPTIDKYVNRAQFAFSVSTEAMAAILLDGIGLSPEQALDLRLGDVFELVE
jgi:hypothetical protein